MSKRSDEQVRDGLAELIRVRREHLGLTFRQLAARSHIPTSTLHRYESGNLALVPKRKNLEALSEVLGVPLEVLVKAAGVDLGLNEYDATYGRREALFIASEPLSDDDLEFVLSFINRLAGAAQKADT
jgi:transcriptional regulator with XRE-family HTH domain